MPTAIDVSATAGTDALAALLCQSLPVFYGNADFDRTRPKSGYAPELDSLSGVEACVAAYPALGAS